MHKQKYKNRNIRTKCGGPDFNSRPFSRKLKLNIHLDQQSKLLYCLNLLYVQVKGYRNIQKSCADQLVLPQIKLFKKQKRSRAILLALYSAKFLKKLTKLHCLNVFTSSDIGKYVYYSSFFPDCNAISFQIFTLAFLYSNFHT